MSILLRPRCRSRWGYLLAVVVTIAAGLASRRFPELLPSSLGKYPGDALWALMVFFGWALILSKASSLRVAGLALATAYTIELLKLWQSPWWDGIRNSALGHLVFGREFTWLNFLAYAVGVVGGVMVEIVLGTRGDCSRRRKEADS